MRIAQWDGACHRDLGDAIERDNEQGDEEEDAAAIGWTCRGDGCVRHQTGTSSFSGGKPISSSAPAQRPQTVGQGGVRADIGAVVPATGALGAVGGFGDGAEFAGDAATSCTCETLNNSFELELVAARDRERFGGKLKR